MQYLVTAAAAAIFSAGAADASIYRYDVTMELTRLELKNAYVTGSGELPDWIPAEKCDSYTGTFSCGSVNIDIKEDRLGVARTEQFEPVLTASLLLDTAFDYWGGYPPYCNGSGFLCDGIDVRFDPAEHGYFATPDSFRLNLGNTHLIKTISSEGIRYVDDGVYDGPIGDFFLSGGPNWIEADYSTTSLNITEIAPVPLPASLPLLGIGIAAIGFAKRRKASRSA